MRRPRGDSEVITYQAFLWYNNEKCLKEIEVECYNAHMIIDKSWRKQTYVPLLYFLNIWLHSFPDLASLLATMLRIGSNTDPSGLTYFHKSGLLFPIVVSSVTWQKQK